LLVDYRGYGDSGGEPSELGLHLDAEAALDYCLHRQDLSHGKLFAFGRSLGGAVAISLVSVCSRPFLSRRYFTSV
jgi:fermentation-respiration switch protein FrsA (DUF1100 family)